MTKEITDQEIDSLTQSIFLRYGVDFSGYEMKSFKRRIVRILSVHKFESIHHLWSHLLKNQAFIHTFMDEISVGMTSMFRDPIFWKNMKRILNRQFKDRNELKIWHAGCSTGEEVYSMGILLKETGLLNRAKALATDINQTAIKEAQEGRYHTLKMPENEKNFKEYNAYSDFKQYYKTEEDQKNVVMNQELVTHVSFGFHNLTCDAVTDTYDLILCRNVMIYFDNPAKNAFMEKFYQALKPGGYFAIGFYDTMLSILNQHKLELVDEEAKIFQKK